MAERKFASAASFSQLKKSSMRRFSIDQISVIVLRGAARERLTLLIGLMTGSVYKKSSLVTIHSVLRAITLIVERVYLRQLAHQLDIQISVN